MRFRAALTNATLLLRVVQTMDKLTKTAILKLTRSKLHLIVLTDMDSGLQLWTDITTSALFSDYRIESVHDDEIYLEFTIDNLQRALKSTQTNTSTSNQCTLRLTKKQHLPVLSLVIQTQSAMGREMVLTQDVPVRVLTPQQMESIREPMVPDGQVHVMMPSLGSVRSVVERMKSMGDRVAVSANRLGELNIRVNNELVDITTYFKGLENLNDDSVATQDGSQATVDRAPGEYYTAVVDMKNFVRFLQSYHVAPKNIVCCIIENFALVFYVYIGSTAGFGNNGVAALNDQNCGSMTYFIPVRQQ
ncbi:Checkpoint protein hus1 [Kickxella alabastrina]|nr:Checkpoint protein hus1 [Kickxella alabastrina]